MELRLITDNIIGYRPAGRFDAPCHARLLVLAGMETWEHGTEAGTVEQGDSTVIGNWKDRVNLA